jgi:MFS superfamily sulfate permease-like transporter
VVERNPIRGVGGWLKSVAPTKSNMRTDAVAGLPGAIGSVPDGMAASVLAGVNPIHGLYASFAGLVPSERCGCPARVSLFLDGPESPMSTDR